MIAAALSSLVLALLALGLPTDMLDVRVWCACGALLTSCYAMAESRPHRRRWRATMRQQSLATDRDDPHRQERAAARSALIQAHTPPRSEGLR